MSWICKIIGHKFERYGHENMSVHPIGKRKIPIEKVGEIIYYSCARCNREKKKIVFSSNTKKKIWERSIK